MTKPLTLYTLNTQTRVKSMLNAPVSLVPSFHTHRDSYEQGLYTCTPTASMFVCFFLKVHHPPLDASESHAGVSRGGGSKAWPGISNRHTEPGTGSGPNWWRVLGARSSLNSQPRYCFTQGQVLLLQFGFRQCTCTGPACRTDTPDFLNNAVTVRNSAQQDFKCHLNH